MPSPNKIIIATAGSGKTTKIAEEACAHEAGRSALMTYTINGSEELRDKVFECRGYVPTGMEVGTWFTFLLRHMIRPYQRALYENAPIKRLAFMDGRSAKYAKKQDIARFFFASPGEIFSDKVSQFACQLIAATDGAPLRRLEAIYDKIFIDEVQDLAGYDLDLVEQLLGTTIDIVMVGDVRQATYRTNNSSRNSGYAGANIVNKFAEWESARQVVVELQTQSHRCVQPICDFADQFYPELPSAISQNRHETGHDGVFAIMASDVPAYIDAFKPQTMRFDAKTKYVPGCPVNFGAAKGKSFDRTLIFPHGKLAKVISTGNPKHLGDAPSSIAKVYVAITRARQSATFVVPDKAKPATIPIYSFG